GELRKGHVCADLPVGGKQGLVGELAELEAAAEALNSIAFDVAIALRDSFHTLGRDVACDGRVHLYKDETAIPAVFSILLQYRVTGGAGASERVHYQEVITLNHRH